MSTVFYYHYNEAGTIYKTKLDIVITAVIYFSYIINNLHCIQFCFLLLIHTCIEQNYYILHMIQKIIISASSLRHRTYRAINDSSKEINNFTKYAADDEDKPTNSGAQSLPVVAPAETKVRSEWDFYFRFMQ